MCLEVASFASLMVSVFAMIMYVRQRIKRKIQ